MVLPIPRRSQRTAVATTVPYVLQGPLELDVLGQASPLAVLVLGRVDHLDTADPGDGTAEPDQGLAVQLIGAAEVVDDLGDRSAGSGMPLVVSEHGSPTC